MGQEAPRPKKILLLGAKGFASSSRNALVKCVSWTALDANINAGDFDIVILNLLFRREPPKLMSWSAFNKILTSETREHVVENGGEIIVIGDPRFTIRDTKEFGDKKEFLDFTGLQFTWSDRSGDTVNIDNGDRNRELLPYLQRIKRWTYSLAAWRPHYANTSTEVEPICTNRYGHSLAFRVRYWDPEAGYFPGHVTCLPAIEASEEEILQMLLRDICGTEVGLPPPKWVDDLQAPGQQDIDDELARLRQEHIALVEKGTKARDRRSKVRKCLKLLYEGQFALEPIVRETLRSLGATVEESEDSTKSDGWVTVTVGDRTLEFVLEVKSTAKPQFDEYGIKQLVDWVTLGVHEREKRGKGLFIGVASLNEPPDKRKDPFPQNWVSKLKLHEFAAIRTEDLYAAYVADRQGRLDRNRFWTALHDTNGVVGAEGFGIVETPRP